MIKVATVFSGIGAAEFALRRLGIKHEIVFACDNGDIMAEYDKDKELKYIKSLKTIKEKRLYAEKISNPKNKINYVKKSYLKNYDVNGGNFFQDINLLDGDDFKGKVDLFIGGSPCQSFSIVGHQLGFHDHRGNLFFEYTRLVEEMQPKVFIYENVYGVLNNSHKETWKTMQEEFDRLGYKIFPNVLNAVDYGIPQKRRRLFVVGFKDNNINFIMNEPVKLAYKMQDFLIDSEAYGGFNYDLKGNLKFDGHKGKISPEYQLTPAVQKYVLKGGTKTWYQKPETDLPIARTLLSTMANHHRAGVDNYITLKDGNLRSLSEREALRLMGFTDEFKIDVSKAKMYKQAGNSIVVDVIMNVIDSIVKTGVFE